MCGWHSVTMHIEIAPQPPLAPGRSAARGIARGQEGPQAHAGESDRLARCQSQSLARCAAGGDGAERVPSRTRSLRGRALLHGSGRRWNSPFLSGSVRRCVRTQAVRVRSLCSELYWPTWISVICLEKLRDWSLGPMTPFQRPICVSIRLRWLYPVARPCGRCCGSGQYGDPERLDPAPIAVGSLRSLAAV